MASQLILDLPHRAALSREDFLVSPSNSAAVELIDQFPNWPSHAALIVGAEGSGKSHLGQVFRELSRAPRIAAVELTVEEVPYLFDSGAVLVEDLHDGKINEAALFHLFNFTKQTINRALFTSRKPVVDLNIKLPDLRSRLMSTPVTMIASPDDVLLRGVLVKQFLDRQIDIHENVISYLIQRMPRSLGFARDLIAEIDREALINKAEVTRPFVARVMAAMET